jgi:hypothetical protein
MLKKLYQKSIVIIPVYLLLFASNALNASEQSDEEESEKPRWFEIEVIVYKPTNENSFNDESWDKYLDFRPSEQQIDFLQPFYLSQEEACFMTTAHSNVAQCIPEDDLVLMTNNNVVNNSKNTFEQEQLTNNETVKSNAVPDNSVIDIHSLDEEALLLTQLNQPVEEKPFQPLDESLLQLSNEAASLRKHPDYQVLTHIAWRQPVLSKSDAPSIRIAGGRDLSESYQYNGNRRLGQSEQALIEESSNVEFDNNREFDASNQLTNEPAKNVEGITDLNFNSLAENTIHSVNSNTLNDAEQMDRLSNINLPLATPTLWVPELDGSIKIHLNRFLHISTDLYLRKPGKEEIEAIDLDLYSPELLSSFSVDSNKPLFPLPEEKSTEASILSSSFEEPTENSKPEQQPTTFSDNKSHQFSWEIGDDFLETESEKIYVERLFNYTLKQSRKVRSGELHFFDHPLLGLFIIIRPYELPTEVDDNANEIVVNN